MRFAIVLIIAGMPVFCRAQQNVFIKATTQNNEPVAATILIKNDRRGFTTDSSGTAGIGFLKNGDYTLLVSAIGFEEKEISISIPYKQDTLFIEMESNEDEMENVVVQSTRSSRTIANTPTRVETISFEEIDEKNNMRPANVAMLLHESTGIQVQQVSATSANASIRIQGLDGRYTQLLKDGFANFGNFANGLSVLEIPPLDLKQVEVIKGPASTLYGGGAIAGVINFISKTPGSEPAYNFIANGSNIGQYNVGGFASGRNRKVGYTLLGLYNHQNAYDVDKDDFTEVPKSNDFTIHPKLFIYPNSSTTIIIGNSFTKGERTGGDINVVKGKTDTAHRYFEQNKTIRNTTTAELDAKFANGDRLLIKQSLGIFNRSIGLYNYDFSGTDLASYTDASLAKNKGKHSLVMGVNFIYNRFKEKDAAIKRNNSQQTAGAYAQHTVDINETFKLESGIRVDAAQYKNELYRKTEVFVLPRISLLVKYNAHWSSRIGGGMGYKTPSLFTEQTETIQYRDVAQLNNVRSEKSYGGVADINFKDRIASDLDFSFNQLFFFTTIIKPLVLQNDGNGNYNFYNAGKPIRTAGFETNARFVFKKNFKLFAGYTFTHAKATYKTVNTYLPLVPRSKLNLALIYEKEGNIKVGLEGYFTGRQYLSNGIQTPSFSEFGFMAEKTIKKMALFINFENFTDTRQSKYKNVVNGSHLDPIFDEIWTHTEGFVVNGGIKLKL